MQPQTFKLLNRLTTRQWLIPVLMTVTGIAVGVFLPMLDVLGGGEALAKLGGWPARLLLSSPEGAQSLLSAAAGALATIAGVAFSLSLVTLQLASNQYTPRLLRRFLTDRTTQVFLGMLVGTVSYLLLVLRFVRKGNGQSASFVPQFSVLLGLVLTIGCLSMLAVFLYHLSRSIQPATILYEVARETDSAFSRQALQPTPARLLPSTDGEPGWVLSRQTGYVQLAHLGALLDALPEGVQVARLESHPGDFLVPGLRLLAIWPRVEVSFAERRRIEAALVVGRERTPEQDPLFGVRQLADIALRALSPSTNDVTTALQVVNELGALGQALVARGISATGGLQVQRDARGRTLMAPVIGLAEFIEQAFGEIRRSAEPQPRIVARVLELFAELARQAADPGRQAVLRAYGRPLREMALRLELVGPERELLESRWSWLDGAPPGDDAPPPQVH